jgi:glycosyltransferase involved in cell wall biosynthesis
MRVGLLAPPWAPVPPPEYGGTELVVAELATGLAAAGVEVTLFATGDSTCPVPLRWHHPRALGTAYRPGPELEHVAAAYRSLGEVDVVHDHTILGPHWARKRRLPVPVVTTVHGPFLPRLGSHFGRVHQEGVHVVGISRAQASTAPAVVVDSVIHHGVSPDRYPLGPGDGGFVAFLGRVCEEKGPHRAIEAARRAGVPIRLAAKATAPDERRFLAEVVEPMLGPDATFLGEIGHQAKVELLQGAAALVNPIRWDEPFGLVMVESMLCGTPVVTFPEGAATELVDEGVTGYLCTEEDDLPRAIEAAARLDRPACRARAVERFSTRRMAANHLDLYRALLGATGGSGPASGGAIRPAA